MSKVWLVPSCWLFQLFLFAFHAMQVDSQSFTESQLKMLPIHSEAAIYLY